MVLEQSNHHFGKNALVSGMSVGSAMHGFYFYSFLFSTWSCLRSIRRFVVLCLDMEDANRLFRYAPTDLKKRKMELFNWFLAMNQKILFFLSDFSWDVKNQKSQDLEGPFAFAKL